MSKAPTDGCIVFYNPKLVYNYEGLTKMTFLVIIVGGGQSKDYKGPDPPLSPGVGHISCSANAVFFVPVINNVIHTFTFYKSCNDRLSH